MVRVSHGDNSDSPLRKGVLETPTAEREEKEKKKQKPMFVDAATMKERLKQNMMKEEYNVCQNYKEEGFCQRVARSSLFEQFTLLVISLNAVWIAIDVDFNKSAMLLDAHPVFQCAEHIFCAYFSFELTMRFGAFEKKRRCLRDGWFVFDSMLLSIMVAETWVMTLIVLLMGGGKSNGLGNASILRLLRLLRLSRMARMAKLLRSMPELLILIKGMASAMRSVFFTIILLLIIIYVFAVTFRQLTSDTEVGRLYFGSMIRAMHTLLLDGALLDSTGALVAALQEESLFFVVVFYIFVLLASLTVMNLLIGVLCEVVSAVAHMEREQITIDMLKEGFQRLLKEGGLDADSDNLISRKEFDAILENEDAVRLLDGVQVNVYGLLDLVDFIFANDDDHEQEKQLTFADFMEVVLSLRGSNKATVKDFVDLRKFIQGKLRRLEDKIASDNEAPGTPAPLLESPPAACSSPSSAGSGRRLSFSFSTDHGSPSKLAGELFKLADCKHGEAMWLQAAKLEGVLAMTSRELEAYNNSLPPARGDEEAARSLQDPDPPATAPGDELRSAGGTACPPLPPPTPPPLLRVFEPEPPQACEMGTEAAVPPLPGGVASDLALAADVAPGADADAAAGASGAERAHLSEDAVERAHPAEEPGAAPRAAAAGRARSVSVTSQEQGGGGPVFAAHFHGSALSELRAELLDVQKALATAMGKLQGLQENL